MHMIQQKKNKRKIKTELRFPVSHANDMSVYLQCPAPHLFAASCFPALYLCRRLGLVAYTPLLGISIPVVPLLLSLFLYNTQRLGVADVHQPILIPLPLCCLD